MASDGRSLNPGDVLSIVLPTETFLNWQRKGNDDLSNYRRRCFSASNTSSENPKTRPRKHRERAQGRIWNPAGDDNGNGEHQQKQEHHRQSLSGFGFSTVSFRDASISIRFCPVNRLGSDQIFIG
jgi:hypothetical protein